MPGCPYPFCGHAYELKDEGFDAACFFQSEGLCVQPAHKAFVEVAYECREQEEHGVLCHERLWQPCPSEAVVHVVEDPFLAAPEVVELHYFTRCRGVVVGQYAAVGVLSLPQVLLPVHAAFPLYDEPVRLAFPLLRDDGIQLIFDAVDDLALPSSQSQQAVIEGGAAVGADIEVF